MANTTSSNKKDLAKISGRKDWKLWTDKLRAYLIRSELEFVMDQPFPNFQIMVPSDVPGLGERLHNVRLYETISGPQSSSSKSPANSG